MRAHWVHVEHDFAKPPERVFSYLAEHENLAEVFGARVADLGPDSIVFELVGSPEEVDSFEELVRPHGLQELGRTGRIGLSRATRQPRSRSQQQVMA